MFAPEKAQVSHRNVRSNRVPILFLLIGILGGALGGGGLGIFFCRPTRQAASNLPPPTAKIPAAANGVWAPGPDKMGASTVQKDAGASAATDGGADPPDAAVCVEVRDALDHPVLDAVILWQLASQAHAKGANGAHKGEETRADGGVGELGVYAAPLPYPEEVIAGRYLPLNRGAPYISPVASAQLPHTGEDGRTCLRVSSAGYIKLTAVKDGRSGAVELAVPKAAVATAQKELWVLLRLSDPMEAMCRLVNLPPLPSREDEPNEPVSDAAGSDISGRIVDGRGFGLAAVRIDAQIGAGRSRGTAISDGRGYFRLAGLPNGTLSLQAQLHGYAPLVVTRRADEPRSDLQLTLRPGGGIAGILRDARRGTLPKGAQLVLVAGAEHSPRALPLSQDGSFAATGLPVGAATLRARAPGYAPLSRSVQIPAADSPADISLRDLRLELEEGGSLSGQVRGATGAEKGAYIIVYDRDNNLLGKALTDDRGEFRMADLPAGHLHITASAGQGQTQVKSETYLELRSGGKEHIYLELRP